MYYTNKYTLLLPKEFTYSFGRWIIRKFDYKFEVSFKNKDKYLWKVLFKSENLNVNAKIHKCQKN